MDLTIAQKKDDAYAIPLGHVVLYLSQSPLRNQMVIEVFDHGELSAITQLPLSDIRQILNSFET